MVGSDYELDALASWQVCPAHGHAAPPAPSDPLRGQPHAPKMADSAPSGDALIASEIELNGVLAGQELPDGLASAFAPAADSAPESHAAWPCRYRR